MKTASFMPTREARLYDLQPGDQLYAVVSGPNVTVPNLSGVHVGGARAEQALWQIHEIPGSWDGSTIAGRDADDQHQ